MRGMEHTVRVSEEATRVATIGNETARGLSYGARKRREKYEATRTAAKWHERLETTRAVVKRHGQYEKVRGT